MTKCLLIQSSCQSTRYFSSKTAKAPAKQRVATIRPLRHKSALLSVAVITAALWACAPVVDNRGYVFNEKLLPQIEKNVTTRDSIDTIFGSPSTVSNLNGGAYYYISSQIVTESYRPPEEVKRTVLAIYFTPEQAVRDYAVYGLENGIVIPIVQRTTRAQGEELGFLEQIIANIGRFGDAAPGSEF